MTPVEYEQYLLAMNEAEFSLYIAKEEEKYQQMKEKAAQRAIERQKFRSMRKVADEEYETKQNDQAAARGDSAVSG